MACGGASLHLAILSVRLWVHWCCGCRETASVYMLLRVFDPVVGRDHAKGGVSYPLVCVLWTALYTVTADTPNANIDNKSS